MLGLIIPTLLSAADLTQDSIYKYLDVSGAMKQVKRIPEITNEMLEAQGDMDKKSLDIFKKIAEKHFAARHFENAFFKNFEKSDITQSELNSVIKFYEGDLGKKVVQAGLSAITFEGMMAIMQPVTIGISRKNIYDQLIKETIESNGSKLSSQDYQLALNTLNYAYKELSMNELKKYLDVILRNSGMKKTLSISQNSIDNTSKKQEVAVQQDFMKALMAK
jgi:leucyl-tRNA synthetase